MFIAINNKYEKHETHEQNMKNMVNIYNGIMHNINCLK